MMSLGNNSKTSLDTSRLRLGFSKLCCVRQILFLWSWRSIKIAASQSSEDGWTLETCPGLENVDFLKLLFISDNL